MFKPSLIQGHVVEVLTEAQARTRTAKLRTLGVRYTTRKAAEGKVSVEYPQAYVEAAAHDALGAARHRAAAQIG